MLVVAAVVSSVAYPSLPHAPGGLQLQLALAAATSAWLLGHLLTPEPSHNARVVHVVGRTALAFVLTVLNPFYAIFAFVGMTDAFDVFRRRRSAYTMMLATALITAGSQSGGIPPHSVRQAGIFVGLVAVNFGLGCAFTKMHQDVVIARDGHAATAEELTRLNADLTQVMNENAALQRRLVGQARETGVQQERQRLAREIHDTLAQAFAGIVAQLEASREGLDPVRVAKALDLAREGLTEARRSVLDLAPARLDTGTLAEALRGVTARWAGDRSTSAEIHVSGDAVRLHPEVEATILRVVQESLTNVARHAAASHVDVTLSYLGDEVIVDIRDDGVGFDPNAPRPPASFGLRGMRQRAQRLAGQLLVESAVGHGTVVSMRLPALAPGAAA